MKKFIVGLATVLALSACGGNPSPTPSPAPSLFPTGDTNPPLHSRTKAASPSVTTKSAKPSHSSSKPSSSPTPDDTTAPHIAVLKGSNVGAHEGFDRVTFTFDGPLPSATFKYVDVPTADGSGKPVHVPGNKYLQIVFKPANAHNSRGSAARLTTFNGREVVSVVVTGDFEAVTTVVVGTVYKMTPSMHTASGKIYFDFPYPLPPI